MLPQLVLPGRSCRTGKYAYPTKPISIIQNTLITQNTPITPSSSPYSSVARGASALGFRLE